ncbi:MAG: dTDP-4-dehydrorhamnose 3,5-epimerase [Alphaproteobacteria bacterium]|nr:dTDP-4-dehydrorhamnose 3,5-epimerase [Alphaproteobacteria bacterium]
MKFVPTPIAGAFVVETDIHSDERGSFMRLYCAGEQKAQTGFDKPVAQANRSVTTQKGSVRGLHYQRAPALESKMVRCTRGRVFDVAVDLRAGSKTFLKHFSVELDAAKGNALLIPEGCAHGFQTLEDDCEMIYLHTAPYAKEHEGGLAHDDPALGIVWPLPVTMISARDRAFPPLDGSFKGFPA